MKHATYFFAFLFLTLFALPACDEEHEEEALLDLSCDDAIQLTISDTDTFSGIEYCPSRGTALRVEATECPEMEIPDILKCDTTEDYNDCNQNSDCTDGKNPGVCLNGDEGCYCIYPCTKDSDCHDDELCPCQTHYVEGNTSILATAAQCVPADCHTNADCPGGECAADPERCNCGGGVGIKGFHCRYPEAECGGADDCKNGSGCGDACTYNETNKYWLCTGTYDCDGD